MSTLVCGPANAFRTGGSVFQRPSAKKCTTANAKGIVAIDMYSAFFSSLITMYSEAVIIVSMSNAKSP